MPALTQTLNFTSLISASPESLGDKINLALQSITAGGRDQIEIQDLDVFVRQASSRSAGVYNVSILYRTPGNSNYFAQGMSIPSNVTKQTIGPTLDEFGWLTAAGMISDDEQAFPVRIKQINTRFTRQVTYHQLLVLWKKKDGWTDTSDSSRRLMVVIAQEAILPGALGTCAYKPNATVSTDTKQVRNISNITLPSGGAAWAYMDIETMELVLIPSCCN